MLHQWISVRIATFLASGFGVGFIPVAPGTFGSVLGVGIVGLLALTGISQAWYALLCVAVFLAGVPISRRAAEAGGVKDPGWIVIDEIAAILFIFINLPFNPVTALLGFLVFRVFDITKPYPIRLLEKLPHGWGIMTDDVAAGFYTGLLLAVLRLVVPISAASY
jgi:phosphatidylglycerophosphatase A